MQEPREVGAKQKREGFKQELSESICADIHQCHSLAAKAIFINHVSKLATNLYKETDGLVVAVCHHWYLYGGVETSARGVSAGEGGKAGGRQRRMQQGNPREQGPKLSVARVLNGPEKRKDRRNQKKGGDTKLHTH